MADAGFRRRACSSDASPVRLVLLAGLFAAVTGPVHAQTGSIHGRVLDAASSVPIAGAEVRVLLQPALRAVTGETGRFVLGSVPAGERVLRIEHLGHQPVVIENVRVRAGLPTDIRIEMQAAPLPIPGVTVEALRVRLIEPDVVTTHQVVPGREVRELPVDRISQVIELTPGVSGGHFRGGRVGQEVYVIDGVELKNAFEASTQGLGLELSPTSLEEIEVVTGGLGTQHGSALSGVVRYVTRRGNAEDWQAEVTALTDHWAPESLFRGFTGVSASGGGPVRFLGSGATIFADALVQALVDADPRARGLTCLSATDADSALARTIRELEATRASRLLCPHTAKVIPNQRGEKLIGLVRFDRPLSRATSLNVLVLRSRLQRQLYTPEFRYNETYQLGQRTTGTLASATTDRTHGTPGHVVHLTARVSLARIDRYLGALDPRTFSDRAMIGGYGLADYQFLGEDFARMPIDQQLAIGGGLPGYIAPGGVGSPFGAAGEGIFFTEGTPHVSSWSRSDLLAGDLVGEYLDLGGSSVRSGASLKLYRVQSYERILSHLAGSAPSYARFYPATAAVFTDVRIAASEEIALSAGVRLEAFRAGLIFRENRPDFLAPVTETRWRLALMPRFGVSLPLGGTAGRTALRFNFGYVAQPPDFRYFLDTSIGDSLRTDIRRQGNPSLSFERGKSYEFGIGHLLSPHVGAGVTVFRKELSDLATGGLSLAPGGVQRYSTNDVGTVNGAEVSLRARWTGVSARAGYALQKATGIASGAENDTTILGDRRYLELPLAFDQRHAIDFVLVLGRAAGGEDTPWSAAVLSLARSGYPLDRLAAAGDTVIRGPRYLPWTWTVDLRLSRDFGRLLACGGCSWRITFDARNLLGRANLIGLSRGTGALSPTVAQVLALANRVQPPAQPIPAESPKYSTLLDLDDDGLITAREFEQGRLAAALDRFDPSLYFGEARQLRLGVEVSFR